MQRYIHIRIESGRLVVMQKPRSEFNERPKQKTPTQGHNGRGRVTTKTKRQKKSEQTRTRNVKRNTAGKGERNNTALRVAQNTQTGRERNEKS